jgi:hypothetical protein
MALMLYTVTIMNEKKKLQHYPKEIVDSLFHYIVPTNRKY